MGVIQDEYPSMNQKSGIAGTGEIEDMGSQEQFGRLLAVDLTSHQWSLSAMPGSVSTVLGGRGFNVWYLFHSLPSGIDPLSPDNIMVLSCGLLTGSPAPAASRLHINSLSPLTGILGSSNIGGYAGAWLRTLDIASVVVTGRSDHPVYLYLGPDGAELRDASFLWGYDAFETQEKIRSSLNEIKLEILTIGPAGERGVRFAAIISEQDHAAGRTGMGAVMGSKNLKALVIARGTHRHLPAVSRRQKQAVADYIRALRRADEFDFFSTYGGAGYVEWANQMGIMGSRNYSGIGVKGRDTVDGRTLKANIVRPRGCYRCPVQCKAELKFDDQPGRRFTRPEFEPMINLGPKCGVSNIKDIVHLDNLCTRLGIDSTSAATVMAFAMELAEKHLLPDGLTQGLDLSWGNAHTMETLLFQMVNDTGLGSLLRLGVKRAAEKIGPAAAGMAAHVKGLELTAYHPSAIMGTALGYAVSSRGGDYNNVYASLEYSWTEAEAQKEFQTKEAVNIKSGEAKGKVIRKAVLANIIVDCLGLCKVPVLSLLRSFNLVHEAALVNHLAGMDLTPDDLFDRAGRIAGLEKRFNLKHAPALYADRLPDRFFSDDPSGCLTRERFAAMLKEYYAAMGWDDRGFPPEAAQEFETGMFTDIGYIKGDNR